MTDPPARPGWGALPWLLLIFLAGLGYRLVYFFQCGDFPLVESRFQLFDSLYYHVWAESIAGGDWLGREAFFMGPLYPYFLGLHYRLFDTDFTGVRLAQTLLGSLNCIAVFWLGRRTFDARIGLIAAAVCSIYPLFFFYENLLLAASLIVTLGLVSGVLLVEAAHRKRPSWWLAAGVAVGLAAAAKANMLLAVPLTLAWILLNDSRPAWSQRVRHGVAFALGVLLIVAPITIRNAVVQKEYVPMTANGGMNLYIGNNPDSNGSWQPCRFPWPGATLRDHLVAARRGGRAYRGLGPSEISKRLTEETLAGMREDPLRSLRHLGFKALLSVHEHEVVNGDSVHFWQRFSWVLRFQPLRFGTLAPLAFLGLLLCARRWRRVFFPLLMVAIPLFTMTLFFVLGRYRLPAVPFLSLFAAFALVEIYDLVRQRRGKALLVRGLVLAGCFCLVHLPITTDMNAGAANALYGRSLAEAGDLGRALPELDAAVEQEPENAAFRFDRAKIHEFQGRLDLAESDYVEAARLDPGTTAAAMLGLGRIEAVRGRPSEAERRFRQAIDSAPRDPGAHHALAKFLLVTGSRTGEARHHAATAVELRPTAEHLSTLGWIELQSGRPEQAVGALRRARKLAPRNAEIRSRLQRSEQILAETGGE